MGRAIGIANAIGFRVGSKVNQNYTQKITSVFGSNLVAHWPLQETTEDYAQCLGNTPSSNNLIPDSEMVVHGGKWNALDGSIVETTAAGEYHSFPSAIKLTTNTGSGGFTAKISVIPGEKYNLKFWARMDGTHYAQYAVRAGSSGPFFVPFTNTGITGTVYEEVVVPEFTAPDGYYFVTIYIVTQNTAGSTIYLDDVTMTPSSPIEARFQQGRYLNALLNQDGFNDKEKSVYFNGSAGSGLPLSTLIANTFPQTGAGTLLIWAKPDAGTLTDGNTTSIVKFKTTSLSSEANYIDFFKSNSNNQFGMQFKQDDMVSEVAKNFMPSSEWNCMIATWGGGEFEFYNNGVKIGNTETISTAWTNVFDGRIIEIASLGEGASINFKGWLSHCALASSKISLSEINKLSTP